MEMASVRKCAEFLLYWFIKIALVTRYKIQIQGFENLKNLKDKGTLILPNHPAEIDPVILTYLLWPKLRPHPIAVDRLFHNPFVRRFLHFVGTISVPNFEDSSNSYKKKEIEKTYESIFQLLKNKESVLIYPAGGLKQQAEEIVGGASGVQRILQASPDVNIVLIRTQGLWGSSFSTALTGKTPDLMRTFFESVKIVCKNLLFFVPKRTVNIECFVPSDFPLKGSRFEVNRYLENWFNAPGKESLKLVSYAFWKEELPKIAEQEQESQIDLEKVSEKIKTKVFDEIAALSMKSTTEFNGKENLSVDLGLDSLDQAQIVVFLKEHFNVSAVLSSDLNTVADVVAFAAHLKTGKEERGEEKISLSSWLDDKKRPLPRFPKATTIDEAFFETAKRMGSYRACVDMTFGEVSYKKLKMAVILFAEEIKKLPGERLGIMLPASIAVNVLILATLLAGKVPVMINWTLGPRNLKAILESSKIEKTISSWRFLDRLDNCDLDGLDDTIVIVEEMSRRFNLHRKLNAFFLQAAPFSKVIRHFKAEKSNAEDTAVILYTSGTESMPKGVPLTHRNILSNLKDADEYANFKVSDVLLGVLPPFHSFGFSITGLYPLLTGLRVAFLPNPTDGRRMAEAIHKWKVSIACLAPTFLKNLYRVASSEQLQSLRLLVLGAEKLAPEIYEKTKELNSKIEILEGYGITECSPILTLNLPDKLKKGVGIPLKSVELLIVHPETLEPLGINSEGLILATGPNIFNGYLGSSLHSPFIYRAGKKWYNTGDLGIVDEHNHLTIKGRLKRFVKIGGEMVSLGSIEEVLLGLKQGDSNVATMAVVAKEESNKKPEIYLFTTFAITLEEANSLLKKSGLSNLIRVTKVEQVPAIPLLGTGKVDYRTLLEKMHG